MKENRAKAGTADAVTVAFGKLEGQDVTVAVQDFAFQGGTLGLAAGEAIVSGVSTAIERATPFLIFTTSGGARMQEGMFALAQMVRTTVAVRRLRAAKLPFIVILTNPTTGGVTASYAMLGDVHIAEPGAVIGFAGRAGHRADDSRAPAGGLPASRIPARPRNGRYGRAAAAAAGDACASLPAAHARARGESRRLSDGRVLSDSIERGFALIAQRRGRAFELGASR